LQANPLPVRSDDDLDADRVAFEVETTVPTDLGVFRMRGYRDRATGAEPFKVADRWLAARDEEKRNVRTYLRAHEIAAWPATYQTIGFVAVVSAGGSYHWRLAGSSCEAWR